MSLEVQWSKKIHDLDSKILTFILFPFARLFNPGVIAIPISFLCYIGYHLRIFKELK